MARLAIAMPRLDVYSETFIRAHVERLPADVVVLHGGVPPTLIGDGARITPSSTFAKLFWAARRRLRGLTREAWRRDCLIRALRRLKPDAVLAEYGPMGVAMMAACEAAGTPLVVHFFGFDAYRQDVLREAGREYARLFEVAEAIVVVSHDMENQLLRLGAPRGKLRYNPCGADVSMFAGAHPSESPPHFVAVGRFVDKKAPLLTLLAFQRARASMPAITLTMVGDGYLLEASRWLAQALGIADAVEFHAPVAHAELASIYGGARAFLQHSVRTTDGDSEGTPVAILEASAMGLPVVSTRHGGIVDVVVEGKTGLLVDEGDVDAMAAAIVRLATDPMLAEEMGRAGAARTRECFGLDQTVGNLWQIIESVILRRPSAPADRK